MLGKNNFKERLRKMEMQSKKDRFSIRKLAIGAASVLLGFSFLGVTAQSAKAETVNPVKQDKQELVNKDQTPKTVGGGVLHSPSTEAVNKNNTASSDNKTADTAQKQNNETNNSTSAKDTGVISDVNENELKPDLKTFPGLTLFLAGNESTNTKSTQDTTNKSNGEQETSAQRNGENTSKINDDDLVTNAVSSDTDEQTVSTKDNKQLTSNTNKQATKTNLDTFSGLSLFLTATPNNSNSDTSAKNINTANRDQTNADDKVPVATLKPALSIPTIPISDGQTALNKAAASLQTAIDQGTTYVNSADFSKMTAAKQAQLRAAMQTGKELMAKYKAMQTATNSAALDIDQNNKNKTATDIRANLLALNVVTTNNIATPNINSTNAVITTSELAQAAHNIMLELGTVNSNISYDADSQTVTISAGEIDNQWYNSSLIAGNIKHINITGRVTVANGDASHLFGSSRSYNPLSSSLQDITGLNNLDTSNVTNMEAMFASDRGLTTLNISSFNTGNVTDMRNMFDFDLALPSLDVSNFDTSKVTDMSGMFNGDSYLTSLDVSNFNTSEVTDMSSMFNGDNSLTSLDVSNFDTSKVTNMNNMFNGDTGLTSLNVSNFDTSNVSNMSNMLNAANLNKLTLGEKTKLASGAGIPGTTWYKDGDLSKSATVADLENGKAHAGTWELTNASVTLKFVNAKHTDKVLYTSDAIPGFTGKSLDLTDSTVKTTYITPNIPTGYTYATTDAELAGQTQPTKADFTAAGNTVTIYLAGNPETNVTVKYELKNGNQVGNTITPTGNRVGDTIDLSQGGAVMQANPIPDGFHYATNPNDMPANYVQPGVITYSTQSQDKVIYVVGAPVAAGDTVKVVHYLENTTKSVPGLTDYILGDGGHYGDTVTASGEDAAQQAPFGYRLLNPTAQTYVLTKDTNPQKTLIFYYTKNGGGSLPEPDRTPKLPIPGEVNIPQDTDLSNDTTYAGDAIMNKDQLPDGTKYSWQPAPDTSKKGKQEGTVVVTYPDGTKTSINVTVNIVNKNANGNGNNNHGEAKEELLKHNAYLYNKEGKRANQAVLKAGSTVTTYGMVVINGRKFFTLANDYYLAAGNAVSQTRKLKHNAYIYNKYGQRVGKKVVKTGQSMATYGTVVTIRGKKYYTIDHQHFMKANNFTKIAYPDLANSELSPNAKEDNTKAFKVKALKHNAYLYNQDGKRANKVILNLNSKVKTYGMKTINGRKFYVADNDYYIAAGNIDATKRKLTHNAYIYSQYGIESAGRWCSSTK